jgi:hypothetical protein
VGSLRTATAVHIRKHPGFHQKKPRKPESQLDVPPSPKLATADPAGFSKDKLAQLKAEHERDKERLRTLEEQHRKQKENHQRVKKQHELALRQRDASVSGPDQRG